MEYSLASAIQAGKVSKMTVRTLLKQADGVTLEELRLTGPGGGTHEVTYLLHALRCPIPQYFRNCDPAYRAFDREVCLSRRDREERSP